MRHRYVLLLVVAAAANACNGGDRDGDASGTPSGGGVAGSAGSKSGGMSGVSGTNAGGTGGLGGSAGADCRTEVIVDACAVIVGTCPGDVLTANECAEVLALERCGLAAGCTAEQDAMLSCIASATPVCAARSNETRLTGVDCRAEADAFYLGCLGRSWSCSESSEFCVCNPTDGSGTGTCPAAECCVQAADGFGCFCGARSVCDARPASEGWISVPSCPPP